MLGRLGTFAKRKHKRKRLGGSELVIAIVRRRPTENVSCMSQKLLQTEPHRVENRGITMAQLFLTLTS